MTIVLLLVAVSTMAPLHHPLFVWWTRQAQWLALGYVLIAMLLLIFNRTRLMFVCLGCSAAICLFFSETKTMPHRTWGLDQPTPAPEKNDTSRYEYSPPRQ